MPDLTPVPMQVRLFNGPDDPPEGRVAEVEGEADVRGLALPPLTLDLGGVHYVRSAFCRHRRRPGAPSPTHAPGDLFEYDGPRAWRQG